jgi:hypothetical protein
VGNPPTVKKENTSSTVLKYSLIFGGVAVALALILKVKK